MASSLPATMLRMLRSDSDVLSRVPDEALRELPLALLEVGASARVVRFELEEELRAWLAAVGIDPGEQVLLLRRAVFGGPLHVRTGAGGEFALNRALARQIVVRLEPGTGP